MRYLFLIVSSPSQQTGSVYSALQLGQRLLVDGHQIPLCFFYGDGVFVASKRPEYPAAEYDVQKEFLEFSLVAKSSLLVCRSSMRRRSVSIAEDLSDAQWGKDWAALAEGKFWYGSLSTFAYASLTADRVLQF